MTCEPKEKCCKSSLKHNQIFLYFIVKFGDLSLPAILTRTRTRTRVLYPRHLDILLLTLDKTGDVGKFFFFRWHLPKATASNRS